MKRCCRCKELLPESDFTGDRSRADGLQHRCRKCTAAVYQERKAKCQAYAAEHAERIREYQRQYRIKRRLK